MRSNEEIVKAQHRKPESEFQGKHGYLYMPEILEAMDEARKETVEEKDKEIALLKKALSDAKWLIPDYQKHLDKHKEHDQNYWNKNGDKIMMCVGIENALSYPLNIDKK